MEELRQIKSEEQVDPEEVINILDQILDTHTKESKFTEAEENRKKFSSIDRSVLSAASKYEQTLGQFLERYGIKNVRIEKIGNGLFRIPLKHHYLQRLPEGYAYIGGAARAVLLRELGIEDDAQPRDKDIVRILNKDVLGIDAELSQKYSLEDYAHGHGVQDIESDYFETRDFTINEILVHGNFIYLTKECILDTVRRILRFTPFETFQKYENGKDVNPKLIAKAIRLSSEEIVRGKRLEIANKEIYEFSSIKPFFIALHLDRAFKIGLEVAKEYVKEMVSLGQLPEDIDNPIQAMDYLMQIMEKPYVFQYAPKNILETDQTIDEIEEQFGHLTDTK